MTTTPCHTEVVASGILAKTEQHIRSLIANHRLFDNKQNIYPVLETSADTCRKWERLAVAYNANFREDFNSYQPYNLYQIWILGQIANLRDINRACSDAQFSTLVQNNVAHFTTRHFMETFDHDIRDLSTSRQAA